MNQNSKNVMLSVIGVAILVVAVIGVSFAFFTYSRTGESNNQITTGTLVFNFEDGNAINITNHFPITTAAGKGLTGTNNVCTFSITGQTVAGKTISYQIYAVPGDTMTGKTRFADGEIFINIKNSAPATGITFTGTSAYTGNNAAAITLTGGKLLLGSGTVTATTSATSRFEVRMWVDDSKVAISDTSTSVTGKTVYTTTNYAKLYYSMKIKVEANA